MSDHIFHDPTGRRAKRTGIAGGLLPVIHNARKALIDRLILLPRREVMLAMSLILRTFRAAQLPPIRSS